MPELYSNMGFRENPFSRFSAEEEKEYLYQIFVRPKYYPTIHEDIKSGASRYIFGERGVGKSALVLNLISDLDIDGIFTILIDDYDGIKISNNGKELLVLTLFKMVTKFGMYLLKRKNVIKHLSKYEKEKLTIIINIFFESLSQKQFQNLYNKTTHIRTVNIIKRVFNYFLLKPVNAILSSGSQILGDTINKALGLTAPVSEAVYKEYFTELKYTKAENKINPYKLDYRSIKNMLIELSQIIKKCNYKGVVILYDKIDEYRQLGTKAPLIANFAKELVLDTSLLLDENISLIFSFWSRIKSSLSDLGARFDKIKPIDITWSIDELKKIIDDRLNFFSDKRIGVLEEIIPDKYLKIILELANKSPRQLLILLSKIYDEQATMDDKRRNFSAEAVEKGLFNYCNTYDFVTFYAGSNPGVITKTVNELLKIEKVDFRTNDLVNVFKISTQAANNKIKTMLTYGFIEDITAGTRAKRYRIIEPRIRYLITRISA